MNYRYILKMAYLVTTHYPRLWILGLFLGLNFTVHFVWFNGTFLNVGSLQSLLSKGVKFETGADTGLLLLYAIVGFVAVLYSTNWAKVYFILYLRIIFKLRRKTDLGQGEAERQLGDQRIGEGGFRLEHLSNAKLPAQNEMFVQGRKFISRNIMISLFTTAVMAVGIIVILIPFVSFAKDPTAAKFVWVSAMVLFLFLALIVSLVGVFASLFATLLDTSYQTAVNLATDLLTSKWQHIVVVTAGLVGVYVAAFAGPWLALHFLQTHMVASGSSSADLANILGNVVLWLWLGVLNTFFYTGFFVLFTELVHPQQPHEATTLAAQAASAQVP